MPKPKLAEGLKKVKLSVTVSPQILVKIDAYAKKHGLTRSAAIVAMLAS